MLNFLMQHKKTITAFLDVYLKENGTELSKINGFGHRVIQDLLDFSSRGKMIRGSLVFLSNDLCGSEASREDLVSCAAVLELMQSALLIHDDIMDRDMERRGEQSLFAQYDSRMEKQQIADHYHTAESLGICAGDIAFFQGFELVERLSASPEVRLQIYKIISREMSVVGVAQMLDVANTTRETFPDYDSILQLYKYKTGSYTFALPLLVGAVLSHAPEEDLETLKEIGELMGIIFQIKDDELGLFGDPVKTGKPAGSDIYEGKKTLHMYELRSRLDAEGQTWLDGLLNSRELSKEDFLTVMSLLKEHGIKEILSEKMTTHRDSVRRMINGFPAKGPEGNSGRQSLLEILEFISKREK